MIKLIGLIHRKPGTTPEEFREHYETKHVPYVKSLMGDDVHRYIRNYPNTDDLAFPAGSRMQYDAITEMHFKDRASFERATGAANHPDNIDLVRADEARFMDTTRVTHAMVDECDQTDGSE